MDHVLGREAAIGIGSALEQGRFWLAYNERNYFLGLQDIHAFQERKAAEAFAAGHAGPLECYDTVHADSLQELMLKLSHGQE